MAGGAADGYGVGDIDGDDVADDDGAYGYYPRELGAYPCGVYAVACGAERHGDTDIHVQHRLVSYAHADANVHASAADSDAHADTASCRDFNADAYADGDTTIWHDGVAVSRPFDRQLSARREVASVYRQLQRHGQDLY